MKKDQKVEIAEILKYFNFCIFFFKKVNFILKLKKAKKGWANNAEHFVSMWL